MNIFSISQLLKSLAILLLALVSFNALAVEQVTYYHNDALGSPIAASDETGEILWHEEYQPYGNRLNNPSTDNTAWYTGKQEESSYGLTYFGARWYRSNTAQFISIDPVGVTPGNIHSFNRYAYANNNPYKYLDPDGGLPFLIPIAIFIAKEIAAEVASQATGGATDFLSVRRLGTKGAKLLLKHHAKSKVVKKVHGNSKASMKEQHLYMIEGADGTIKKIGVSGQKLNKNGSSPRANSQLKDGDKATVLESGIPGRSNVLQKEAQSVEGLRKAGHELPKQKRPK